jgi:2-amino-4-hydroxy-6-hydroxymethyldihydropteridine diphosphokinase
MKAWLGLGSNLDGPTAQLQLAHQHLNETTDIEVLRVSSLYRTTPWGDEEQGDFVNAVVQIKTSLSPLALLHVLQSIEDEMGRQRNDRRWGPRVIDIDLLLHGESVVQSAELELPHARMHERAFVLLPIAELEPNLEIPGRGVIADVLTELDCSGIYRLRGIELNRVIN